MIDKVTAMVSTFQVKEEASETDFASSYNFKYMPNILNKRTVETKVNNI